MTSREFTHEIANDNVRQCGLLHSSIPRNSWSCWTHLIECWSTNIITLNMRIIPDQYTQISPHHTTNKIPLTKVMENPNPTTTSSLTIPLLGHTSSRSCIVRLATAPQVPQRLINYQWEARSPNWECWWHLSFPNSKKLWSLHTTNFFTDSSNKHSNSNGLNLDSRAECSSYLTLHCIMHAILSCTCDRVHLPSYLSSCPHWSVWCNSSHPVFPKVWFFQKFSLAFFCVGNSGFGNQILDRVCASLSCRYPIRCQSSLCLYSHSLLKFRFQVDFTIG